MTSKYCEDLRRRRIRAKAAQNKYTKSWLVKLPTPNLPTKIIPKICRLKPSGKFTMGMIIPPLNIKTLLESTPLKSMNNLSTEIGLYYYYYYYDGNNNSTTNDNSNNNNDNNIT